ncbi:MAG: IPTL-CTERM sorting domain-containing protein [Casimicrobiaceae bacterium]
MNRLRNALIAGFFAAVLAIPAAAQNLSGHNFRLDLSYAGVVFATSNIVAADPAVEVNCPTPSSTGPGCGSNINGGGYTIDFQDHGIVFQTNASFGSQYGSDRNYITFTLLDPGVSITAASLVSSNFLPANRVTFTANSVRIDFSGLPAPAVESADIAITIGVGGVTPPTASPGANIPTLSTWALIALAGLLAVMFPYLRRRGAR